MISTTQYETRSEPLLFRNAGVAWTWPPNAGRSSIDAWMELIEVVELLCPRWPERVFAKGLDYRL
jgi:hypothetical protein